MAMRDSEYQFLSIAYRYYLFPWWTAQFTSSNRLTMNLALDSVQFVDRRSILHFVVPLLAKLGFQKTKRWMNCLKWLFHNVRKVGSVITSPMMNQFSVLGDLWHSENEPPLPDLLDGNLFCWKNPSSAARARWKFPFTFIMND